MSKQLLTSCRNYSMGTALSWRPNPSLSKPELQLSPRRAEDKQSVSGQQTARSDSSR